MSYTIYPYVMEHIDCEELSAVEIFNNFLKCNLNDVFENRKIVTKWYVLIRFLNQMVVGNNYFHLCLIEEQS